MSDAENEGYRMGRTDGHDKRDELERQRLIDLTEKASLMPCSGLPRPDSDKELVDFLFRIGVAVRQAARDGRPEARFQAEGIQYIPLQVMKAAITPLEFKGYRARVDRTKKTSRVGSGEVVEITEVSLVVSGWADS